MDVNRPVATIYTGMVNQFFLSFYADAGIFFTKRMRALLIHKQNIISSFLKEDLLLITFSSSC